MNTLGICICISLRFQNFVFGNAIYPYRYFNSPFSSATVYLRVQWEKSVLYPQTYIHYGFIGLPTDLFMTWILHCYINDLTTFFLLHLHVTTSYYVTMGIRKFWKTHFLLKKKLFLTFSPSKSFGNPLMYLEKLNFLLFP